MNDSQSKELREDESKELREDQSKEQQDNRQPIFREKAMEHISSPEHLTDYLRVTNTGMWVILGIVVLLLVSLFAWSFIGTLETTVEVKVVVDSHQAEVISPTGAELNEGMPLRVLSQEIEIASIREDDFGRGVGVAEVELPDGTYDGTVVTETIRPFDFLLKAGE